MQERKTKLHTNEIQKTAAKIWGFSRLPNDLIRLIKQDFKISAVINNKVAFKANLAPYTYLKR